MDKYAALRTLPFDVVASVLGVSLEHFKRDNRKKEWVGPCPIHQSKTNKGCFRYNDDGRYNCFSQGCKGRGSLDLTMAVKQIAFQAAADLLGAAPKSDPPKQKEPRDEALVSGDGELKPYSGSYEKYKVPCPWLEERIPDQAVREKYGVFCYNNPARKSAYSGRVMIPVKDVHGVLYGYLGRHTGDTQDHTSPKYLFPSGLPKSRFLFGAAELKQAALERYLEAERQQARMNPVDWGEKPLAEDYQLPSEDVQQLKEEFLQSEGWKTKLVYLVESPFAVMKFASMGIPAVSPFGWSVSPEQCELLCSITKGLIWLPDANKRHEAGNQVHTLASHLWLRFPPLPDDCQDPEQMSREQILAL
jgi:DNA primase